MGGAGGAAAVRAPFPRWANRNQLEDPLRHSPQDLTPTPTCATINERAHHGRKGIALQRLFTSYSHHIARWAPRPHAWCMSRVVAAMHGRVVHALRRLAELPQDAPRAPLALRTPPFSSRTTIARALGRFPVRRLRALYIDASAAALPPPSRAHREPNQPGHCPPTFCLPYSRGGMSRRSLANPGAAPYTPSLSASSVAFYLQQAFSPSEPTRMGFPPGTFRADVPIHILVYLAPTPTALAVAVPSSLPPCLPASLPSYPKPHWQRPLENRPRIRNTAIGTFAAYTLAHTGSSSPRQRMPVRSPAGWGGAHCVRFFVMSALVP